MSKKAFTLTELLIALGIIGAIAAMCIPNLLTSMNNKILATQLKNNALAIEQLAGDQLVKYATNDLSNTDFATPEKLLTSTNFNTVKICTADNAASDCWGTSNEVDENGILTKPFYKTINGGTINTNIYINRAIILKNGALLSYALKSGDENIPSSTYAQIDIDVNGQEPPNIDGRDLFTMYIDNEGHIIGVKDSISDATLVEKCKNGWANYCFTKVLRDNWKMKY